MSSLGFSLVIVVSLLTSSAVLCVCSVCVLCLYWAGVGVAVVFNSDHIVCSMT